MTINTIMLVALGFLVATLLAVIIAPAYRNRTMRLTADALRRSLPLSETEIRAERDRLRAEHAIRIHNLESQLERVTLDSARQKIEVNRRDARISELEGSLTIQARQIEELDNAKRVLEQTVTDRLPKIEGRLGEARRLLQQRDNEVTSLAETAQRQARAIAEATQINNQQGMELEQLKTALSTRASRNQDALADQRFDGEVALRSEIEALRAKARDQTSLIERLQSVIANPSSGAEPGVVAAVTGAMGAASKATLEASLAEFNRLQSEFAALKSAYALARAKVEAAEIETSGARTNEADLIKLRSENRDLAAELARAKAALAAYEAGDGGERSTTERGGHRETPIAMKAKIAALEAEAREHTGTIDSLRAEITGLNERLARQSAHYLDEMKRLGAGTVQTSGPVRPEQRPEPRRSLAERITDPRIVKLTPLAELQLGPSGDTGGGEGPEMIARDTNPEGAGLAHPGSGQSNLPGAVVLNLFETDPDQVAARANPKPEGRADLPADAGSYAGGSHAGPGSQTGSAPAHGDSAPIGAPAAAEPPAKPRRQRLLERITSIDKPGE